MPDIWHRAIDALSAQGPIGTILHLGAGSGAMLSTLRASSAENIVVLEPNPAMKDALLQAAGSDGRVRIVMQAIGTQSGTAPLHVFNMEPQSSLQPPTGIGHLFPGLRETASPLVDVRPLADLVDDLPLQWDKPNVLILDAPGAEATVLDQLAHLDPALFRHIFLRAGKTPLYEGAKTATTLLKRLKALNYAVVAEAANDPAFPLYVLEWHPPPETSALAKLTPEQEADIKAKVLTPSAIELLRDAELQDLKQRYRRLRQEKDAQDHLLQEMTDLLAAIARFLQDNPDVLPDTLTAALLPVDPGASSGAETP